MKKTMINIFDDSTNTMVTKEVTNNESSICAKCGQCCKKMPCHIAPIDVFGDDEPTIEKFVEFVANPKIAIDWWEGDPRYDLYGYDYKNPIEYEPFITRGYYLRPAVAGIERKFDASWGGACCFLTETGCALDWEHRPLGGKTLVPPKTLDEKCVPMYTKCQCAVDWTKYHEWFEKIYTILDIIDAANDYNIDVINFARDTESDEMQKLVKIYLDQLNKK